MNVPLWVTEVAEEFWRAAGEVEGFPRDLRRCVARAVPLSVVLIANLSLHLMKAWLERNGIGCAIGARDRPVLAGLVARRGHGFAFVDGTDSDSEQRFSLAHELAHFLRDYWHPRRQVEARLGPAALEVVDGLRPPTPEERLQTLLLHAPMELRVHLLDRNADRAPASRAIAAAEQDADRLAYELLAPAATIAELQGALQRGQLARSLVTQYGFPEFHAARYATILLPGAACADPLLDGLKGIFHGRRQ